MDLLERIFGGAAPIAWYQECARAILVFAYGLLLVRLAGRRVFGKWAALDIVVSVIIGSNLSRTLTGNAPLIGTLLATGLLFALHWLLAHAAARSELWARLLEGRGVQLAKDGTVRANELHRNGVTGGDINEALRTAGIEDIDKTRLLTLEPSGRITVLKE